MIVCAVANIYYISLKYGYTIGHYYKVDPGVEQVAKAWRFGRAGLYFNLI